MARVLIVDDEEPVRRLLGKILSENEYSCVLAADSAEARGYMEGQDFEVMLCDVMMPGESGMHLAQHVLSTYPETAVIMVTGIDNPRLAKIALEAGAYGYVIKPFEPNEVIINVANALRRRQLEVDNRLHRENLEKIVQRRNAQLLDTLRNLKKTMEGTVRVLAAMVEMRDPGIAGHQERAADLARALAVEMGLSDFQANGIHFAGTIHDLGKVVIPAEIHSKPGRTTDIEYSLIKTHARVGYDILKDIEFPWPIAETVHQHHERLNGSGYPRGLTGKDIMLEARILAVADVVEAMASHRPHRAALGIDAGLQEILRNKSTLYDAKAVEACLKLFKEKRFEFPFDPPRISSPA